MSLDVIPPFKPLSEALMSNLASRPHEWKYWQIEERLYEVNRSRHSASKRRLHLRVVLMLEPVEGQKIYLHLVPESSGSTALLDRDTRRHSSESYKSRALNLRGCRSKNSHGYYSATSGFDKLLTTVS